MTGKLLDTQNNGDLLFYQTEDGRTRVEVHIVNDAVWLSLNQLASLFQRDKSVVSRHISNIFSENELSPAATVAKYATVQNEGSRQIQRNIEYFNLDVIISVGYRVKSYRGTQFRIWATQRLHEYLVKGFTMDDERLKQAGGGEYFDELLARIRDIRSSEKVFWKKVLDIYATSVDYDPDTKTSQQFFRIVQNKMHWAAHGHTAAEIIAKRADADKPLMGLTSYSGSIPKQLDVGIAKNYLNADELDMLNRIVSFYLDFAELQAKNRRVMYMADWISKLDDFLRLSEREVLTHAGKITHEDALAYANGEFDKFIKYQLEEENIIETNFNKNIKKLELMALKVNKVKSFQEN